MPMQHFESTLVLEFINLGPDSPCSDSCVADMFQQNVLASTRIILKTISGMQIMSELAPKLVFVEEALHKR